MSLIFPTRGGVYFEMARIRKERQCTLMIESEKIFHHQCRPSIAGAGNVGTRLDNVSISCTYVFLFRVFVSRFRFVFSCHFVTCFSVMQEIINDIVLNIIEIQYRNETLHEEMDLQNQNKHLLSKIFHKMLNMRLRTINLICHVLPLWT